MSQSSIALPTALDLRGRRVAGHRRRQRHRPRNRDRAGPARRRTCCWPIARRLPRHAAEIEWTGATCTTAEGDLTSDTFIASLFTGGRVHAVAHCAAILEGAQLARGSATGTSGSTA